MRLRFGLAAVRGLLRVSSRVPGKVGPLSAALAIAERWSIKTRASSGRGFPFVQRRRTLCFQVLVYHRVNNLKDPIFGGTPVEAFRNQMAALATYFNVHPLEDLVERAKSKDLPPRAVAITFDDGYRDNYEYAFPILKGFGLPATIFLATGAVNGGVPLWHDLVFDAFRRTEIRSIIIDGRDYGLRTQAERRAGVKAFRRYFRNRGFNNRNAVLSELTSKLAVSNGSFGEQYLNWHQVEKMSKAQITFGAHTVTHPVLTTLPLREVVEEVTTSKETIERKLGTSVRLFAYPNGQRSDFDENIKEVLKNTGFSCAATTLWGNNDEYSDPFELRRIGIWNFNPQLCALKLGGYKFCS